MESGSQYVSKLNELAQIKKLKPPVYEDLGSSGPDHMKVFTMRVSFAGEVFPEGVGSKKLYAKHDAAKNAYEKLMKETQEPAAAAEEPAGQDENNASGRTGEEDGLCENLSKLRVSKVDIGFTKKVDYVSLINKHCQIKKITPNYIEVKREGPSHNLQFTYSLQLNNQQYPEGKAKNKKEAQQLAAQSAYLVLREQPDWDSKMSVGSAVSEDEASEISTSTSAIPSSLLEPGFSAQSNQSNGSDWIQFEGSSKPSDVQGSSSVQDTGPEKNSENGLTSSLEPSRFESDFDCITSLGKGSYGCVYKARHKVVGKYHAIKEICFKNSPKTLREVKVLESLSHPNIVRYFNSWLQDTGYNSEVKINTKFLFIEMELCEGGTLRRWICKKNKEPAEKSRRRQSLEFSRQIFFELFWRIGTGHERIKIWADVIRQNLPKEFTETYQIESRIIKTMLSQTPEVRPEASALITELKRWTESLEGNTDQGNQTI